MRRFLIIFLLLVCWCSGQAKQKSLDRTIFYPSVDQNGDELVLSGRLCIPEMEKPKGIILLPHFTISANEEAPSNKLPVEAKYFKNQYVLVMPDYIGFGVTCDRVHPYLHGELTARNCVDMLLSAQPILDSLSLDIPLDSIYVVGFSQGGVVALWTLKLLEEEYADRIHVKKCFVGSAPSDVATTYDDPIAQNVTGVPAVIPMLVMGTSEAYNLHLQPEDFFSPAMMRIYNKYIKNKNKRMTSLYFLMPNHKISHWMTTQGMDKTQPETERFYEGLLRSSLVHYDIHNNAADSICPAWIPQAPLYVFHSTNDNLVPFQNALHLRRCYQTLPNIIWDFDKYGGHVRSMFTFLSKVQSLLDK